ncbi:MAG: hypothetical protein HFJ95_09260 [Muribaculaceae bacterium]|uniref:PH domain-containing protein n=1 Tax=uncultured Duncaniella sp. TaxID=2768039 RepID=UPI0026280F0F|nr:PH domain-containing protein [uncultured Duncaniella sp.]MCI8999165.1 hypothetical protein [Muribaculaceae bacterium]
MKQKVKFSTYSLIITAVVLILCVVGIFSLLGNVDKLTLFCIIMGVTIIAGLYFCPKSIQANESSVTLHRLLSSPKVFNYDSIQSVDTCYPSAGGLRLCASGGFFGYWGYFSDIMIGAYFGYYGSRSNCFLIKMKDGKQYVLGCDNAVSMVDYIKSQLCK